MKPALVILAVAALAAAAGYGSTKAATKTVTVVRPAKSSAARPHEVAQFGYIKSLKGKGNTFEMQFDPAWFTSGETANAAAAADGAVEPGEPVPNDNYVVEEGHRVLTYAVPASARVTVLTRGGNPEQLGATPISVSELARIVDGGNHRPLSEPITTGFWISVDIDHVRSLAQQYRP